MVGGVPSILFTASARGGEGVMVLKGIPAACQQGSARVRESMPRAHCSPPRSVPRAWGSVTGGGGGGGFRLTAYQCYVTSEFHYFIRCDCTKMRCVGLCLALNLHHILYFCPPKESKFLPSVKGYQGQNTLNSKYFRILSYKGVKFV